MGASIAEVLAGAARRHTDRVAVVEPGPPRRSWTFAELHAAARRVAADLGQRGVAPGARVGVMVRNSADFYAAWFGAIYAGAAVVPLPILSAPPEVALRIRHARLAAVIGDAPRRATLEQAIAAEDDTLLLDAAAPVADATGFEAGPVALPDGAPAMILYTSGTTGRPKGAVIGHRSLLDHTRALVERTLKLGSDDRILGAVPLTHSFGARMVMLCGLFAGATAVLIERFDAERCFAALTAERVTWLPGVPTMFNALSRVAAEGPPPALRWGLCAGAPIADEVVLRAEARLGAEVRGGYGMTEATFSTINAPPDERVLGSVGRPVPGVEVRIDEGEVLIRGRNVMDGYLDDPEATAAAMPDGWVRSGDIGRLDDAGRLHVVDRLKDLIIRGGNNVYPSEVEEVLATHPGVAQVAVVGRPDDYYGEEVVAVVVPAAGVTLDPAELVAWSRERVARTKYPREVLLVDALPLGPSGKVLKRELRARLASGAASPVRPV